MVESDVPVSQDSIRENLPAIPDGRTITDRSLSYIDYRLRWLDQEITRYRDFEWKVTSFHAAFFAALLYLMLDVGKRALMTQSRYWLLFSIVGYGIISCAHLVYIHYQLNRRRNERNALLAGLGVTAPKQITRLYGLVEGVGVIFPIGFLLTIIFLALTLIRMIVQN